MPLQDILSRQEDLGKTKYYHEILSKGSDFEACKKGVLDFFRNYQLVRYSHIAVIEKECLSASNSGFSERLEKSVQKNRAILHELIAEFEMEDIFTLNDLEHLPQGYKTKMLHVITHLLDGFFGIDTYFYNLVEDSHWVSDELLKTMKSIPSHYWIISVEAVI